MRFWALLTSAIGAAAIAPRGLRAAASGGLTIEDYVHRVLTGSDRAVIARNTIEAARFTRNAAYGSSRGPSVTVGSTGTLSRTDSADVVTRTGTVEESASLVQPLYLTGARLSASILHSRESSDVAGVQTDTLHRPSYQVDLDQPLPLFVGNPSWRQWRRDLATYDVSRLTARRELQQIESDARALYYDVLLKTAQLAVEEARFDDSQRARGITAALVRAGRQAGVELSRANTRLRQAGRRVENARTALQQARNLALSFAYIDWSEPVAFVSDLAQQRPLPSSLPDLIAYALQHRPDFLALQRDADRSSLDLLDAQESNNPAVSAHGTFSTDDQSVAGVATATRGWMGSLALSWPIFDSRVTHAKVEALRRTTDNDRSAVKEARRQIETEVTNAYLDRVRIQSQIEDAKTSRDEASRSSEIVRMRYKNGAADLLDVFDAQNDLRDIELEYLDLLVSGNLASDKLALLIGQSEAPGK